MKSFSEFIKFEILNFKWTKEELNYLIQGFLKSSSILTDENTSLKIKTTLEGQAKKLFEILKKSFDFKITKFKKNLFTKNQILINLFNENPSFKNRDFLKPYIAGIFLSKGLCNSPDKKNYHLEIRQKTIEEALNLKELLFFLNIKTKELLKKNWYYIYIKNPIIISDFLKVVNANEAMLILEEQKIQKDYISSTQRLAALEEINLLKTKKASYKQIEAIKNIKSKKSFDSLPLNLRKIAELRLKNKNLNLSDLAIEFNKKYNSTYSKSAINHWLRELVLK